MALDSMKEIFDRMEQEGKPFWEIVLETDMDERQVTRNQSMAKMLITWQAMADAADSYTGRRKSVSGLVGGDGMKMRQYCLRGEAMSGGYVSEVIAEALSMAESNACMRRIVAAPTAGACGVLPAVLYHISKSHEFTDKQILHALATAGLVGNIVKKNASISGADVGCQGEVGVACAMASAASCQLFGGSPSQIEYAAEMGLEHHLGMTCDPICGLVQIPCIERNAFAATRALDSNLYAAFSDGSHRVSFDRVVEVMKRTGHDIPSLYKETSEGGLAKGFNMTGNVND